jgi:two-component system response regulator DevR
MDEQTKPLRILIVDDHAVVRKGLQAVLSEEGLEVIGEAASGDESVAKAMALRPDVVLMDIRMGEGDDASGIDACRQIRSELPDTQVIMFTSYGQRESVLSSIMAGATGFLTKNVSHTRRVEAIRAAGRGRPDRRALSPSERRRSSCS